MNILNKIDPYFWKWVCALQFGLAIGAYFNKDYQLSLTAIILACYSLMLWYLAKELVRERKFNDMICRKLADFAEMSSLVTVKPFENVKPNYNA
jgi:hypothetical protein